MQYGITTSPALPRPQNREGVRSSARLAASGASSGIRNGSPNRSTRHRPLVDASGGKLSKRSKVPKSVNLADKVYRSSAKSSSLSTLGGGGRNKKVKGSKIPVLGTRTRSKEASSSRKTSQQMLHENNQRKERERSVNLRRLETDHEMRRKLRSRPPPDSSYEHEYASTIRGPDRYTNSMVGASRGNQSEEEHHHPAHDKNDVADRLGSMSLTSTLGAEEQRDTPEADAMYYSGSSSRSVTSIESSGKPPDGLCGLTNMGNTCFMNSCLQVLSNCPPLAQYFRKSRHKREINTSNSMKGELALAFGALVNKIWSAKPHSSTRPVAVKKLIAKRAKRFSGYQQHDAQEFLIFLLDALHDDLNRVKRKGNYEEIKDVEGETESETAARWWENYESRNDSHIKDVFSGQLKSRVECLECGHVSTAFDPFMNLSLPLPRTQSRRGESVELMDCFRLYSAKEELSGDEAYYCSKCKTHQPCTKQLSVKKYPPVLILHLKRFAGTSRRSKLSTSVNVPKGFAPGKDASTSPRYDLIGVINHMGSAFSGHYTANAKNAEDRAWYTFNDSNVSSFSTRHISGPSAYVLFYMARSLNDTSSL